MVARDYGAIANSLPETLDGAFRDELAKIFHGGLDPRDYDGAHDIRAQLAFAAKLKGRGYAPRFVATADRQMPDFILPFANMEFGLEVKRPLNSEQTLKRLDKAARQLQTLGLPGFVVLDLSRLHGEYQGIPPVARDPRTLGDIMRANFSGHAALLVTYCQQQQNNPVKRDKFSYIMAISCYVEIPYWLADDPTAPALLTNHTGGAVPWSSFQRGLFGEGFAFANAVHKMLGTVRYGGLSIMMNPQTPPIRPAPPPSPPQPPT
jgi:hypothetical protein